MEKLHHKAWEWAKLEFIQGFNLNASHDNQAGIQIPAWIKLDFDIYLGYHHQMLVSRVLDGFFVDGHHPILASIV